MRTTLRAGFTLIEMLVVIAIIGILVGLLLPAVQSARAAGRRTQCQSNIRQVSIGIQGFVTANNYYPNAATIAEKPGIIDPSMSYILQSILSPTSLVSSNTSQGPLLNSWVVDILPFIDSQELYNSWNRDSPYYSPVPAGPGRPSNFDIANKSIGILQCPDDPSVKPKQGNLSYVVNGGYARFYPVPVCWNVPDSNLTGSVTSNGGNGEPLQWVPSSATTWQDTLEVGRKLGVMFMGTSSGNFAWDVKTTTASFYDGAGTTLLVGENFLAGASTTSAVSGGAITNWACPFANFVMFMGSDLVCAVPPSRVCCICGQLTAVSSAKDGPGWANSNPSGSTSGINGALYLSTEGSAPYANSFHTGGANFAFCDGSVRFLQKSIHGSVYGKLITPSGALLPVIHRQLPVDQDAYVK